MLKILLKMVGVEIYYLFKLKRNFIIESVIVIIILVHYCLQKIVNLVNNTIKDPYIFDFITLKEEFKEQELESALVTRIRNVLLELGNVTAVNEMIKKEYDTPTIGLLLCRGKNRVTVDWSMC